MIHRTALFVAILASLANARHPDSACGTHSATSAEVVFLHRKAEIRRPPQSRLRRLAAARLANRDYGQIAVIDDAGIVSRRNPFNLDLKTIAFTPATASASRYRISLDGYSYIRNDGGTPVTGLGDDDATEVHLPFPFPFYGQTYTSLWINSNGNLTFGKGDGGTTTQSFGRLHGGAPRIAALFEDLDPSHLRGGSVRVRAEAARFTVTFDRVPEFSDFNFGQEQTFQIRLHASGLIEIAYDGITALDAVVGIAPGGLKGTPELITLSVTNTAEFSGPVGEVFAGTPEIDIPAAAQKFYATHGDSYDYLVFFNALNIPARSSAVAWESTVRSRGAGFGSPAVSVGDEYGSASRLQAVMNMGPLPQYPSDPNRSVAARGPTGDTPLTILAHEAGHLYLAFVSVEDEAGNLPMLGTAGVHWAFNFNSEASVMEGNRIRDNGSGSFSTIKTVEGYSALDQYLMGFIAPSEVPPTFYVANANVAPTRAPQSGIGFTGNRRNITVDDIIAAAGRRTPDSTVAQRRFRFAFILIAPAGSEPAAENIAQVETYRSAFETFFGAASGNTAAADATLKRALAVSTWPAAGTLVNGSSPASITLQSPAPLPLTLLLERRSGLIEVPPSVTIPAGQLKATFQVKGVAPGVDDLIVRPADSAYETVATRIRILPTPASLTLASTDGATTFSVTDVNNLPYGGVTLTSGTQSAVTDERGQASLRLPPGTTAAVSIAGGPSLTVVVPAALLLSAVTNAASYAPGITPGAFATLWGAGLDRATQIQVNGQPVPVIYSSPNQVNFRAPASITGAAATLNVVTPTAAVEFVSTVQPVSPGIFAVVNRGAALEIYATGLNGAAPQVTVGGQPVTVLYAGQPQFPGLDQINVAVAEGQASGKTVIVTAGAAASNAYKLP